jgi:tetratricopeptide (TPR) repeat protein
VAAAAVAAALMSGCDRGPAPGPPEALIRAGWDDYRLGDFNRATARFEAALQGAPPGRPAHLQALYGLATTWNLRRPGEDTGKAEAYYRDIVQQAPTQDLAAWSLLALARMRHLVPVGQEPDYPAVRKAYQEVVDQFPFHLAGEEAFVYQQSTCLLDENNKEEVRRAAEALDSFVREHRHSRFVSAAYSLLSTAHRYLGDSEQMLACAIRSLETAEIDPLNPRQTFVGRYWSLAAAAEFEVGDFETARHYYQRVLDERPLDPRVLGAKLALKRMDDLERTLRTSIAAEKSGGRP